MYEHTLVPNSKSPTRFYYKILTKFRSELVTFKHKPAIPKFLVLRKLTPKILNILNRLLLAYILIYFDEIFRTANLRNTLL